MFGGHSLLSALLWWHSLQVQVPYILQLCIRLRMQVKSKPDVTALFDRLMAKELPGRRGLAAWRSLLRAHATLLRRLDTEADGRGVLVVLTNAGVARLTKATPVHLRGVSNLFVGRLSQKELAVLKSVLDKVTVDCTFG